MLKRQLIAPLISIALVLAHRATQSALSPEALFKSHQSSPDTDSPAAAITIKQLRLSNATLAQSIEEIRKSCGANLVANNVSPPTVSDQRLGDLQEDDWRITLNLHDVTLETVFELIFDPRHAPYCAQWNAGDNSFHILPTTAPSKLPVVNRVYDIRDIIDDSESFARLYNDPKSTTPGAQSPPPSNRFAPSYPTSRPAVQSGLIRLIKSAVPEEDWIDNNLAFGQLTAVDGRLSITQTLPNHRRIEAILRRLQQWQNQ